MRSDAWRSSKAATSPLRFNRLPTFAPILVLLFFSLSPIPPAPAPLPRLVKFCAKTGSVLANSVTYVACALFW